MASFLQLSKSYVSNCFETLRSRRSRHNPKTAWRKIKNPASSAGRCLPEPSSEGFARSSTVVYPVFVTNLTSISKGRLPVNRGHRAPRSVFRHQRSIPISRYSSSRMPIIFAMFSALPCEFHRPCGNQSAVAPVGVPAGPHNFCEPIPRRGSTGHFFVIQVAVEGHSRPGVAGARTNAGDLYPVAPIGI